MTRPGVETAHGLAQRGQRLHDFAFAAVGAEAGVHRENQAVAGVAAERLHAPEVEEDDAAVAGEQIVARVGVGVEQPEAVDGTEHEAVDDLAVALALVLARGGEHRLEVGTGHVLAGQHTGAAVGLEDARHADEGVAGVATGELGLAVRLVSVVELVGHPRAAEETRRLLDALGVERAVLWGHSDGAVVALWMALQEPKRFPGLVLESVHAWPFKPRSRAFFHAASEGHAPLSPRTVALLERDHGARWPKVVQMNGRAWVALAAAAGGPREDLYGGALPAVRARVLLLCGRDDPRTEPGEMEWLQAALPSCVVVHVDGRHAPHAEADAWRRARGDVLRFVREAASTVRPGAPDPTF